MKILKEAVQYLISSILAFITVSILIGAYIVFANTWDLFVKNPLKLLLSSFLPALEMTPGGLLTFIVVFIFAATVMKYYIFDSK